MAAKEYTKGEVINLFGRVLSLGIAMAGTLAYVVSRVFSKSIRGAFWLTGLQVDAANSLKAIKMPKSDPRAKRHFNRKRPILTSPSETEDVFFEDDESLNSDTLQNDEKLISGLNMIKKALDYSQSAYNHDMLPIEEVIKVDGQALAMAKAVANYLKEQPVSHIRVQKERIAANMIQVCHQIQKFHSTGNPKFEAKAKKLLVQGK